MGWPYECWFNVYASGQCGMLHPTREQCDEAGFPSCMESDDAGARYRVHVRLKTPSEVSSNNRG